MVSGVRDPYYYVVAGVRPSRLAGLAEHYYNELLVHLQEYDSGGGSIYALEGLAQLLAQSILGYAAVLASMENRVKPSSYKALAGYLARRLRLPEEYAGFLVALAGFRNILVHMYGKIEGGEEERSIREIAEKTQVLLMRCISMRARDPCISDVAPVLKSAARDLDVKCLLVFGSLPSRCCGNNVNVANVGVYLGRRPGSLLEVGRIQALLQNAVGVRVDLVVLDYEIDPVQGCPAEVV